MNFINKYIGEDGLLSDAAGYHRSLSIAMNPDKFAKFFYEQGQAAAVDGMAKKSKTLTWTLAERQRSLRRGNASTSSVSQDSGRGLKIRSKRT